MIYMLRCWQQSRQEGPNQPSAGRAEEPWGPDRGPTDEFLLAFGRTKHSGKGRLSSFLSAT